MDREKGKPDNGATDLNIGNEGSWNQYGDNVAGNKNVFIYNGGWQNQSVGGNDISSMQIESNKGEFLLEHSFKFFGREKEVKEVISALANEKIIIVHGEGGIGKTELCREVIKQSGRKAVPVNLVECRTYWDFIVRVAGVLGIGVSPDTNESQLENAVFECLKTAENTILYLDNFEDVISEKKTVKKDRRSVYAFLQKCRSLNGVSVLISSREIPERGLVFWSKSIQVLDEENAVKLFKNQWQGKGSDEEIKGLVISELHCYPLSIVLCANQWQYSLEKLREKWRKAKAKVKVSNMENDRHESIQTALFMTYEEIEEDSSARELWELFTLFPDMIAERAAESVVENYDDVIRKLVNLNVIHIVETDANNQPMLVMQPTLREYITGTEMYQEDIGELSERLKGYYVGLYDVDRVKEHGSEKDREAIKSLQDVLFFMDYLREQKMVDDFSQMHKSVRGYYMEDPYAAVEVVSRALEGLDFGDDNYSRANVSEYCGGLEMRTDKLSEAEGHYREAKEVYRRIHADLGLANVLQAQGDLATRTDKLSEAEGHYREAEEVYRRIQEDLGLANVLQAQGDLEMRTDKLAEAEGHYREAKEVYRRIQDDLGLANVLKAQGDLATRTDKLSEAEGHYREAEEVYQRIQDDLGLANVLKAQGDLEMRTDKLAEAEGHYREAEDVYRRIQEDLGLANVLQAQGALEMRSAKLAEAEGHYREAEDLYRRIHADLGLANVLKSVGNMLQKMGKYEQAAQKYESATLLYEKTQEMMGASISYAELCYCSAKLGDSEKVKECLEKMRPLLETLPYDDVKDYCADTAKDALGILGLSF